MLPVSFQQNPQLDLPPTIPSEPSLDNIFSSGLSSEDFKQLVKQNLRVLDQRGLNECQISSRC